MKGTVKCVTKSFLWPRQASLPKTLSSRCLVLSSASAMELVTLSDANICRQRRIPDVLTRSMVLSGIADNQSLRVPSAGGGRTIGVFEGLLPFVVHGGLRRLQRTRLHPARADVGGADRFQSGRGRRQLVGVIHDVVFDKSKGSGLFVVGFGEANPLAAPRTHRRFQIEATCNGLDPAFIAKRFATLGRKTNRCQLFF